MAASGAENPSVVASLLSAGADPNAVDTRGVAACHMAAEAGAVGVVTALLEAGADCTLMAHSAITPLIVAAAAGEICTVELLLTVTKVRLGGYRVWGGVGEERCR